MAVAGAGRDRHRRALGAERARRHAAGALPADGHRHLGVRAEVGRACDAGGRGGGDRHSADESDAGASRRCSSSWRRACTPGSPSACCRCSRSPTPAYRCRGCRSPSCWSRCRSASRSACSIGKPLGIFGASWLAIKSGLAARPEGASWAQLLGVGLLGGIGFTMSLFIGMLAFDEVDKAASSGWACWRVRCCRRPPAIFC